LRVGSTQYAIGSYGETSKRLSRFFWQNQSLLFAVFQLP
jgi:hypothetical protein